MISPAPKLFLLDLDGTLVNSIPDLASAANAMLQALGHAQVSVNEVENWVGNGIDLLVRRALAYGDEDKALAISQDNLTAARVFFDKAYLEVLSRATGVFPGVQAWLDQTSTPKVLITNKARKFTEPLLVGLGWESQFVQVICGDDLAEKKPSPMPLLHACTTQQIAPENTVMIGDSRHDIGAAKAAGIRCVAVTYGYNHGQSVADFSPDFVVDSLAELL